MEFEHKKYLSQQFDVKIQEGFDEEAKRILEKYGCWLDALYTGKIESFTDAQKQFIKVCNGWQEPRTKFEKIWLKYILEEKFVSALDKDRRFQHDGSLSYHNVRSGFELLVKFGHKGAIDWLEKEKQTLGNDDAGTEAYNDSTHGGNADNQQTGYAPGLSSIQPDWSEGFDDMGPSEWENTLDGPDE